MTNSFLTGNHFQLQKIALMRKNADHIAGITDHYAMEEYKNLYNYKNIYAVCQSLNRMEGIAADQVQQVLCAFLQRLTELYHNTDSERKNKLSQVYHAVFAAIMAAVTFNGIKDAESRCYFLDVCMDRGRDQQLQMKLYLSYCYFLNGMEKMTVGLQHLADLKCLSDWTDLNDEEAAEISIFGVCGRKCIPCPILISMSYI